MTYTVKIANADVSFDCNAEQNILDAAHQANVLLSYGCKSGICGSCEGVIKQGQVTYPDGNPRGLTEQEISNGKVLLCKAQATSDLIIDARVERPETQKTICSLPVKVEAMNYLAEDVMQLLIKLPSTEENFDFMAGQWIYFVMKDGKKRAFSIANIPDSKNILELHIRHAKGGIFTDFVFNQLKVGDILKIEGPHGTFFYHEDYRDLLMVAGGTGFAPLKGIIEALINNEKMPKIHLYWGVRTQKDLYMADQVKQWHDQGLIHFTAVLSDPNPDDNWQGKTGFVHEVIEQDFEYLRDFAIYMAGPPQMVTASRKAFIIKKARPKNIYFDSFEYSEDVLNAKETSD